MKEITAVFPFKTKSISVTGNKCSFNCSHCGRKYLHSMESITDTIKLGKRNFTSVLISGGMNKYGYVPLDEHEDEIKKIKELGLKINIHTGIMPKDKILKICPWADKISFDFVSDKETISKVYHTNFTAKDYITTFENIREIKEPEVHVTLGLLEGKIKGEYNSIDILSKYDLKNLIFLVFIPTKGTLFEKCSPPSLDEIDVFFNYARKKMPNTDFILGCMHPRGKYISSLEDICVKYEFKKITMPSSNFENKMKKLNITVKKEEECCII